MSENLTPDQLIDKWVAYHEAETAPAGPETLAQRGRREFAAVGVTIDGLPDDASEELVVGLLENLISQLQERAA